MPHAGLIAIAAGVLGWCRLSTRMWRRVDRLSPADARNIKRIAEAAGGRQHDRFFARAAVVTRVDESFVPAFRLVMIQRRRSRSWRRSSGAFIR